MLQVDASQYSMSIRNVCAIPPKANAPEWPYTRFDWAPAVIDLTARGGLSPAQCRRPRPCSGDEDVLKSALSTPDRRCLDFVLGRSTFPKSISLSVHEAHLVRAMGLDIPTNIVGWLASCRPYDRVSYPDFPFHR